MTNIVISYPSFVLPFIGSPHSQSPLVQGLIVGPTPNPSYIFERITLFRRKLFPVLYFPATPIIPNLPLIDLRKLSAYFDTLKPKMKLDENVIG